MADQEPQRNRLNVTDSPPHSKKLKPDVSSDGELIVPMLILSDHCILDIFNCMDIETLCQIANVCKRFQSLSEIDFPCRYYAGEINIFACDSLTFRHVLCKFGQFILNLNIPFVKANIRYTVSKHNVC